MRERTRKILAALLLALFVAFVGANTLCTHTHIGPQGMVTHSHPYLPSGHHSHSAAQFDTLAALNALNFESFDPTPDCLPAAGYSTGLPAGHYDCLLPSDMHATPARRGPPAFA